MDPKSFPRGEPTYDMSAKEIADNMSKEGWSERQSTLLYFTHTRRLKVISEEFAGLEALRYITRENPELTNKDLEKDIPEALSDLSASDLEVLTLVAFRALVEWQSGFPGRSQVATDLLPRLSELLNK